MPSPFLSVTEADADIVGSLTGDYRARHPLFVCSPDLGPVVIEGSVDLETLDAGGAVMIGLIDKGFHEAGPTATWGSGAYAYFGHIDGNLRIGPSDGSIGGELNQVGANVPFPALPVTVDFTLTIDGVAKLITVSYDGVDYVDDYGAIEDAGIADAYPGAEFESGAIIGVDIFPLETATSYRLAVVSGCVGGDDEGPLASNVLASPNPAPVGGAVTVTADVDDTSTGGSNIASAEYSLDGVTWAPMGAADGVFDEVVEGVSVAFAAPALPDLYEVCVRGTDDAGNVGEPDCTTLVIYDPAGGFVTGGGWIDSPGGAFMPSDNTVVSPADLGLTWFAHDDGVAGVWDVSFAVGPAPAPLGQGSARFAVDGTGRAVLATALHAGTRLDAIEALSYSTYRDTPSGGVLAVSLQLDVDYDLTDANLAWQGRLVFEPYQSGAVVADDVWQTWDALAGEWWSTGAPGNGLCPQADPCTWAEVLTAFPDAGVRTSSGMLSLKAGGPWTDFVGHVDALTIDLVGEPAITYDFELDAPSAPTGKATFGFVAKYKKGAQVPDGNTVFQFTAADLAFHSTSYEWLVVNQGGENAQFKGEGTVNGVPGYKFMLWAGDHDAGDTFRIRITEAATDAVVYDNGMDQLIGGGNIIVHDGKGKN